MMTPFIIDKIDQIKWSHQSDIKSIPIFKNPGSTTKYFLEKSADLSIQVLSEKFTKPNNFEQQKLNIEQDQDIWIRLVKILIDGEVAIIAKAAIYTENYDNNHSFQMIQNLNNYALGRILFDPQNNYILKDIIYNDEQFVRNRYFANQELEISLTEFFNPEIEWN